jgi:hypothetical protein
MTLTPPTTEELAPPGPDHAETEPAGENSASSISGCPVAQPDGIPPGFKLDERGIWREDDRADGSDEWF